MNVQDTDPVSTRPVPAWIGDGSRLLLVVLLAYFIWWVIQYAGFLFDPMLQADDARTSLFPLHRYGPERALAEDPIASGMLAFMPPAVIGLYRILIPLAGLLVAAKIVQGFCLLILVYAFVRIVRSPRAGLGAGAVLLFLFLHTPLLFQRGISGGLPRGFAFPLMALWFAGAITDRTTDRRVAAVLSALTYPTSMIMILAAEGLYSLRKGIDLRTPELRNRLMRYGVLVLVCAALLIPFFASKSEAGRIHTLEEALEEPAFYRDGRLLVLPFQNPAKAFVLFYARPLLPARGSVLEGLASLSPESPLELFVPLLFTLAGLTILFRRRCPFPVATTAFVTGAVILYLLSRLLAFRLYSPERFYSFTMPMAAIFLMVQTVGLYGGPQPDSGAKRRRNIGVVALMVLVLAINGDGIVPGKDGMTLDGREHADLYRFAANLPVDVLFASHPLDGDDIPLWSARATLGGFETLQPWFVDSWREQKERTYSTLAALYSDDRSEILEFCRRYGVTHLLLHRDRYGEDFIGMAGLFEPFDSWLEPRLASMSRDDLMLSTPPTDAIVFESGDYTVLDTTLLTEAWDTMDQHETEPGL
ncbi:MAG: hypothetical protein IFK94_11995 [Acidobacteria bacterium]|uniref:Uncharacterized protein n=1 Tax=Candidatus Polarisedimenticola svalbardensis TaxID=2886004 RepID=A0A8J6Y3W5_9BACT|nr:hypothetical protein [Candidatus Polarisedimenticola svalbardensis]